MVLLVLVILVIGGLMLRVSQGPMEIGFAKRFIESELSDPAHKVALAVGKVYLAWSRDDMRPEVTLQDVQLINTDQNRLIFAIQLAEVSFSRTAILLGHIEPRSIYIEKPLITLIRDQSGRISLALDQNQDQDKTKKSIDIFEFFDRLSDDQHAQPQNSPLRSLRAIVISNARLMVEDHVLGQSWLVPKINLGIQQRSKDGKSGLSAIASIWLENEKILQPTLNAEATYLPEIRSIAANLAVTHIRADFLASKFPDLNWLKQQTVTLDGQAQATINSTMGLSGLSAKLQSRTGSILIPDVYDKVIAYKSLDLNLSYDDTKKTLTLQDSPIVFADDFSVHLNGSATKMTDGRIQSPLHIRVDNLPQARVVEYWPMVLKGDPSEEWALKRLSNGRVYDADIDVALDAIPRAQNDDPDKPAWSVKMTDLKTDFNVDGMTVDYRDPLMPVKNAKGHGHYDKTSDQLVFDVESGTLGDLKLTDGKVVIDTVAGKEVGKASIDAQLDGPLKTVLQYIAEEPISVKSIPTDINKVEGTASLKVKVSFPTLAVLPAEKVAVIVDGKMDKVLMPGLVHDLDVAGGSMTLKVKDKRVDVAGKAKLDGRDTSFTFGQFFESKGNPYSGQVVANIEADAELRRKFGLDLADWIDGTIPAKVTYTDFGSGKAQVDVEADATPATLMVKAMNYIKPSGQQAKASAKANIDHGILTDIQNLNVETADAKVENGSMSFVQSGKDTLLKKGNLPKSRLKQTNVALDFSIADDKKLTLNVKGAYLDATPFLASTKKTEDYKGPAISATLNTDKMQTSAQDTVGNAHVNIDMDNQGIVNRLEFNGDAGKGQINFRYVPDGQKMTLNIRAQDAGAALQDFDVYENVRGGTLEVDGSSVAGGDKKVVIGKAKISNFRVVNAPVLARLVNALSLPGILQLLGSDGISFSRLESDFTWTKKKGGDLIAFKDGRTSGASMGLTFEGTVDRVEDVINITGTIVPVSLVNDLVSGIPLIGDILSGGSHGGLFAATYSIKGPTAEPTTMVNPLAILTPGFLRRIFFE